MYFYLYINFMNYNKVLILSAFLALSAGLSSCADESGFMQESYGVHITFRAETENEAASKASLDDTYSFVWENGDQLGLFIDNAQNPTVNSAGTASVQGKVATYIATVNSYSAGDRLYAYYPYAVNSEREDNKVRLSIPSSQTQTYADVLNGDNFPMVAVPYTFVSDASLNEEPNLHFKHLAAFVEFDIYAAEEYYVGEKVHSVELLTSSTIAGAFQFDYASVPENLDFSIIAGASSSVSVTLVNPADVKSSIGNDRIYMAVKPGRYDARVRVTTDRGVYLYQIPDQMSSFERAYVRRFALGLKKANQIVQSSMTEYKDNYIGAQTNTTRGVYFDLETAVNYGASGAVSAEDRKKTDLVLFYSSTANAGMCFAAPACSDLSNFKNGGVIDCFNWSVEEKNKTKIHLLSDFTEEDYASLTPAQIENLTEGWESLNDASYHRQNKISAGTFYAFKTVQMDPSANVKEVVSAGVMKITGINTSSSATRCVKFDYKIYQSSSVLSKPSVVTVSGDKLMVDGSEFIVKGVAANKSHAKAASIGANAVRVYNMQTATISELGYILDDAWMNKMKVCVGIFMFPWNQNAQVNFYNDNYSGSIAKVREHVRNVVEAYKNHPAVLMWCIGNECEAAYDGSENLTNGHHVWNVINEFAGIVKELDANHPVTTCLAKASNVSYIHNYCSNLDLLMVNSYGNAIPNLSNALAAWNKPFIVGEFAHQGTWAMPSSMKLPWMTTAGKNALVELTSTQKAADYVTAWNDVLETGAKGGFAFQWGYQTHGEVLTWFGMHDKDGNTFGVADELQKVWTGAYPSRRAPVISNRSKMKMNGKTADSGVIVNASQSCTANVEASSPTGSALSYKWIIIEENTKDTDGSFPAGLEGLITNPSASSISFKAPSEAGAYRLYAFVYDKAASKVASACIPFQVTE